jgi:hypothetical protein
MATLESKWVVAVGGVPKESAAGMCCGQRESHLYQAACFTGHSSQPVCRKEEHAPRDVAYSSWMRPTMFCRLLPRRVSLEVK